ncbi:phosphohydrolase [Paenibacillus sp. HMSSN-139]|nr:phosphohydrolase [Paenibacillus sp. HMSSN-139]
MDQSLFRDTITSKQELNELCGYPSEPVKHKVVFRLDPSIRDFISKSPMLFMATSDAAGHCDVSPRGDEAGFVLTLDDFHLVIPERPGNKRFDSLGNLVENPRIGLIFIIPGLKETLRINGQACIIRDQDLMERLKAKNKVPLFGIGVKVEECYMHCAKSFIRSQVWEPSSWLLPEALPNPSAILAEHTKKLGRTEEEVRQSLQDSYENRLY